MRGSWQTSPARISGATARRAPAAAKPPGLAALRSCADCLCHCARVEGRRNKQIAETCCGVEGCSSAFEERKSLSCANELVTVVDLVFWLGVQARSLGLQV